MPRNACRECRSRKAKCILLGVGEKCERCVDRNLRCSFVNSVASVESSGRRVGPSSLRGSEPVAILPNDQSSQRPSTTPRRPVPPASTAATVDFVHSITNSTPQGFRSNYVIGAGTASEILREGELTKDLLRLYFEHFSDVNFMFHQDSFLREFDMGEVSQVVLYPMMALGIRFSEAPCFAGSLPSHRGETLIRQARRLLKDNFDHVSLRSIQAYALQCTYWLTFGAARKAWVYLGIATTMAKSLRLETDPFQGDIRRVDDCRRIVCNLALLDRILSPSFNMQCYYSLSEEFREPLPLEKLRWYSGQPRTSTQESAIYAPDISTEIFRLSHLLCGICTYYRKGEQARSLNEYERQHLDWQRKLQGDLAYTALSFDKHRRQGTLRQFLFLHLLHNHIGQLLYFPTLGGGLHAHQVPGVAGRDQSKVALCQYHAARISEIVDEAWRVAGVNVHNTCCGQILTVSAAVHMHSCLTSESSTHKIASLASINVIMEALVRMRRHCRIFDRISTQLDAFFQICNQNNAPGNVYDGDTRLLRRIMHYGTAFERLDETNAHNAVPVAAAQTQELGSPPNVRESVFDTVAGAQSGAGTPTQQLDFQSLDWLTTFEQPEGDSRRFDWLFSEDSLYDLHTMAYMDFDSLMANYGA